LLDGADLAAAQAVAGGEVAGPLAVEVREDVGPEALPRRETGCGKLELGIGEGFEQRGRTRGMPARQEQGDAGAGEGVRERRLPALAGGFGEVVERDLED